MFKKGVAVTLILALSLLSGGLEPWAAAAQVVRSAVPAGGARSAAPVSTPKIAGRSSLALPPGIVTLRGPSSIAPAPAAALPVLAEPAPVFGEARFARALERLQAPSLLESLPAEAPGEKAYAAAGADFARRLGLHELESGGELAEIGSAQAFGASPILLERSRPRVSETTAGPRSPEGHGRKQFKSPVFPAAGAALAASLGEALRTLAAFFAGISAPVSALGPAAAALHAAAAAAGIAALGAGAVFAAAAVVDVVSLSYGMWRGREMSDAGFWDFVRSEVIAGRLDAGVAELLRVHRPERRWSLDFGFSSAGYIYLRPELAATPWLFRQVLAHELRHVRGAPQRGPPVRGFKGWLRRLASELSARAAELTTAKVIRKARVPVLERALRLAQISLALARPYEVLVVNGAGPEIKDPQVYHALSGGSARVESLDSSEPQAALAMAQNRRRFGAVVLDHSQGLLPEPRSADDLRLAQALDQLDSLFVLATRMTPQNSAFSAEPALARRYEVLTAMARNLSRADGKSRDRFETLVRDLWQDIASTKLKGMKVSELIGSLYEAMVNKGVAFLPFGPDDAGLPVWEKLLRFWEAPNGGQFRLVRVDLENGGHILILRKIESRVGLWLRPTKGFLATTIPDAGASSQSREAARNALSAAGFGEQLVKFDELEVDIRHVFGADVGRQEIYVTVPRRNAGAIRRYVTGQSIEVGSSRADFEPHLFEAGELHSVKPVWQAGITGADGTIMWIDTGADKTHPDFEGRLDVVDMVNEGPEDWNGHGTHVAGISISGGTPYTGMAKGARGIMAKVFSR
jgi:hypothetical protein